jgi:UDPglucose 6-dehydrogenase/GDP-mannose 6-dehydrogenase
VKVSIVGTGYVGLVSGVCLAEKGHRVTCVDIDGAKIERINQGIPPIFEAGLEELLRKNLSGNFHATTHLKQAVLDSEITLIAVGTPFDGIKIDLGFMKQVAQELGKILKDKDSYHTVVVKSTVVPGTTDTVVKALLEEASSKEAGTDFGVGMNPEFLTEGQAVQDFMNPDRIVLGGIDERSIGVLESLYVGFDRVEKIRTNTRTAEMIKYTSNALLATMISFSNEIANLCSALGDIDAVDVMRGVHASNYLTVSASNDVRVKAPLTSFLYAGCGFGGSCLPKDVKALIAQGRESGVPMRVLESVIKTNEQQPKRILSILRKHFGEIAGLRVGILGLAFKPDTDDMRESPAIPIIRLLLAKKAIIKAYDPVAVPEAKKLFSGEPINYASSLQECLGNVDVVLLVTSWKEFERVPDLLKNACPQPLVLDGRRQLDKLAVARYAGIGL